MAAEERLQRSTVQQVFRGGRQRRGTAEENHCNMRGTRTKVHRELIMTGYARPEPDQNLDQIWFRSGPDSGPHLDQILEQI